MEKTKKQKETAQLGIDAVMHRTWKILLIVGLLGLTTLMIFLYVKLLIGMHAEDEFPVIWFASSMMCLITSGLIAAFVYGKRYIRELRDWIYGA